MPPPPQPKRGARASLLDRLIDPESAGTAIMTGYSDKQMADAVRRDLEELLNSTHCGHLVPPGHPETLDSVAVYGLPDLASVEGASTEGRANIGKAIKRAIERFEPRLRFVKVTVLPGDDHLRMSVRFRVDAKLMLDPAPEISFDTILDMGSGVYTVTPAAA